MVTKNMENTVTPNSTPSNTGSTKRFRFDSFAMEFACKEKDISPISTRIQSSSSSSHHHIHTSDTDIIDNDSGIGKYSINHFLSVQFF